jgi:hypothetical protein
VAFTLANSYSTGTTIANLTLANVYLASNLLSTSTELYNNRTINDYITDLPTPGYVNLDDVDHQIFNIANLTKSMTTRIGEKIWVAKDTARDWNVYRVCSTPLTATTLTYTLDSYAQLQFNNPHTFTKDDWFMLKDFNDKFDGLYQVISAPNQLSVIIQLRNVNELIRTSSRATGSGLVHTIVSSRTSTVDAIGSLQPTGGWINWDRVWVDHAVTEGWGVYTFNRPWRGNAVARVTANTIQANAKFGTSVRVSSNQQYIYAGGVNGVLQVYANVGGKFLSNVTVSNTASGFGSVIATQGNLLIVGAPDNSSVRVYRHNDNNTSTQMVIPWYGVVPWTTGLTLPVGSFVRYTLGSTDTTFITTGSIYTTGAFTEILGNLTIVPSVIPWQPNLDLTRGNIISYRTENDVQAYLTTGNVYANAFSYITGNITTYSNVGAGVYANLGIIRSNSLPVGSLISYNNESYIVTRANIGNAYFANVLNNGNVQPFTVQAGRVNLLQTITSYKNTGLFGTDVTVSQDRRWLFVSQPLDKMVRAYYVSNANTYNATYTFVSNIARTDSYDSYFGNTIRTNADGTVLFVGAPEATNVLSQVGNVYVYTRPNDFPANTIPAWTANTVFGANSYISHNSDVYRVSGNTFAGNVAWQPGVVYQAGANVYYDGNTYQFLYTTSTTSLSSLEETQPEWAPNTNFTNVTPWIPYTNFANLVYVSQSGSSYQVTGNVYGVDFTDATVQANLTYAFAGVSSQFVTYLGNTYSVNGNVFSPAIGYVTTPQPSWSSNIDVQFQFVYFDSNTYWVNSNTYVGTRAWGANANLTLLPNTSYISFQNNTYFTTGNVFAPNVQWQPGVVFALRSNVFYNGNSFTTGTTAATGNIFYSNIYWSPNTAYTIGSNIAFQSLMYYFSGNAWAQTFANVSTQQQSWTPNTVFAANTFVFHANVGETTGNTYRVVGNAHAANFANIAANNNPRFIANTISAVGTLFSESGGTYRVVANTYAANFANIAANNNPTWSANNTSTFGNTLFFHNNNTYQFFTPNLPTSGGFPIRSANIYAPFFANLTTNNNPVWTANTVFGAGRMVWFQGNTYFVGLGSNTYAANFANIIANNNPTWSANNTSTFGNTLFFHNNNTYQFFTPNLPTSGGFPIRSANIYAPFFANITTNNNPVWTANTISSSRMLWFQGNTYYISNGANVYTSDFANISANNNPVWTAGARVTKFGLLYHAPTLTTYRVLKDATFNSALITTDVTNGNLAVAFSGNRAANIAFYGSTANITLQFAGNVGANLSYYGSTANITLQFAGPTAANLELGARFAWSGATAATLIPDLRLLTNRTPNNTLQPNVAANVQFLYSGTDSGFNTVSGFVKQIPNSNVEVAKFGNLVTSNRVTYMYTGDVGLTFAFVGNSAVDLLYSGNDSGFADIVANLSPVFGLSQTISPLGLNTSALFGASLDVDATASNLFIGAPGATINNIPQGMVARYTNNNGTYVFKENLIDTVSTFSEKLLGLFGSAISVSPDGKLLTVGGYGGAGNQETMFDNFLTQIDSGSMLFIDQVLRSGTVFVFEPLINQVVAGDLGYYTFVQELPSIEFQDDRFGYSVSTARSVIAVGAPETDPGTFLQDGDTYINYITSQNNNAGNVHIFYNNTAVTGWNITRHQLPKVDIDGITRTLMYKRTDNSILAAIDFIDPAKGKVLSIADRDIDYKRVNDPAVYNGGSAHSAVNYTWGPDQIGKIWWDLDAVRYVDYEQDTTTYRLSHWGEQVAGSEILVYEWIESTVLPSQYVTVVGDGVPRSADDSAYCTYGYVDQTGNVKTRYYFWVKDKTTVNTDAKKVNSVYSITAAIKNPQTQGVTYVEVLRNDTVALYNVNKLLTGTDTVLHLGGKSATAKLIHNEYALVQEGNPTSQIPTPIQNKFIDSLAGIDVLGNPVPDPALPPAQAYGVNIRPRQSMFVNRALAVSNYITLVNNYLITYPVIERKVLTTLNSSESVPTKIMVNYSQTVDNVAELNYINTAGLAVGYLILVSVDSGNQDKWAVYEWTGSVWVIATRTDGTPWLQSYKTNLYWTAVDWYNPDYTFTSTTTPELTVANNLELGKITLTPNTYVKILNNGDDAFIVYYVNADLTTAVVAIESGTIQISTNTIPALEMRQIALAMQNQILITDLAKKYNDVFFTLIKYALSEQKNIDWVFKTSFISATQSIRKLQEYISYIPDNQSYYLDYINEVKPYRTVLREFLVNYQGNDNYDGYTVDFDLPPYYDANLKLYRGPDGTQSYDTAILNSGIYQQWSNYYTYRLVDVTIIDPGTNFASPPVVDISGGGGSGANAYAVLDAGGGIGRVVIVDPGTGYTTLPSIRFIGTGTGARAYPVLRNLYDGNLQISNLGHNLIRNISTKIKFDRISYEPSNTFVVWDQITTSNIGQVLLANSTIVNSGSLFSLTIDDWVEGEEYQIDSLFYFDSNTYVVTGTNFVFGNTFLSDTEVNTIGSRAYTIEGNAVLGTVNLPIYNITATTSDAFTSAIDRIAAFSNVADYSLTQTGIGYPGVIVEGGNLNYDGPYDSTISSLFATNLGVDPEEIDIDGGRYVDTYSSHAPEELVPGRVFDSLNLQVEQVDNLKFRFFDNMQTEHSFYRIRDINTTTLAANLHLTDSTITVTDPLALPGPDRPLGIPGVVFIGGEKIHYYRNYAWEIPTPWAPNTEVTIGELISYNSNTFITTGNVFDPLATWTPGTDHSANSYIFHESLIYRVSAFRPNVNAPSFSLVSANANVVANLSSFSNVSSKISATNTNILTQLRRAVDGTGPQSLYTVGTSVVDSSIQQEIPYTSTGTYSPITDVPFPVTAKSSVSFGLVLTSRVSGYIGNTVTQVTTVPFWNPNTQPSTTLIAHAPNATSVSTYTVTGNAYAAYFSDVSIMQPTWVANITSDFSAIPWTANATLATIPTGTYVTHGGNTYLTTGNVYAPSFGNIIGLGNTNPAWTPYTVFSSNTFVTFGSNTYFINGGANVWADSFDVIASNISPVWTANTVFSTISVFDGTDTYQIQNGANIYAWSFANISANNNPVWTANTIINSPLIYFSGNTYTVQAGANLFAAAFTSLSSGTNPTWTANTVINSQFIYYSGNTYIVNQGANVYAESFASIVGNVANIAFGGTTAVGVAFTGDRAATLAFTGDRGVAVAWSLPTVGNVNLGFVGTNARFTNYSNVTYRITGNIYAPYFANISQQQPTWLANTTVAPVPTWVANTNTQSGYIHHSGNSYIVSTVTVPNPGVLTTWTANTVIASPIIRYFFTPYLVTGNVYGASFFDSNVQANLSTNFTANIYSSTFANITTPAMVWIASNTMVSTQEFVSFAGTTYQVKGNVYGLNFLDSTVQANLDYAWNGDTAVTYSFPGDTTGYLYYQANTANIADRGNTYSIIGNIYAPNFSNINVSPWLANVAYTANTYVWYANVDEPYGRTYITTGNAYAPYFANVSQQQPTWLANTVMTPVPTWAANTNFANASYVFFNGNSYLTSGNVYGMMFSNVQVQANVTLSFAGDAPPYIYHSGNTYTINSGANVYAPFFANLTGNNQPWQSGGLYPTSSLIYYAPEGNTYVVLNNAFGTSFDTVKSNANVALAFTGNTGVKFAWAGNSAVSYSYEGGANVALAWAGNSTVEFAWAGNTAVQYAFAGNTFVTATFRLLETVSNANILAVLVTGGSVSNLPDVFDNPLGFDVATFDNASQEIFIDGVKVQTFVRRSYILGLVDVNGIYTVPRGTTLTSGNVWYDPGRGTPSNGRTLALSNTPQAQFIKKLT